MHSTWRVRTIAHNPSPTTRATPGPCPTPTAPSTWSARDHFLEHVEEPERLVGEMARVLAPSGLFFFHTFNRNFLAWLVVIKGVEWFVKNTPHDLHVLRLFLKPDEVFAMCLAHGLQRETLLGSRPLIGAPFWRMLRTGSVPSDFAFTFTQLDTHRLHRRGAQSYFATVAQGKRFVSHMGAGTPLLNPMLSKCRRVETWSALCV